MGQPAVLSSLPEQVEVERVNFGAVVMVSDGVMEFEVVIKAVAAGGGH